MLNQPTIEKLQAMKLHGMAEAFQQQIEIPESSELSFEERLGLLVDRQWTWKEARALTRRVQLDRFKERGVVEDINYQHPRGLDRKLIRTLATSDWVRLHHNVLLVGPTGIGKSWLACAVTHKPAVTVSSRWLRGQEHRFEHLRSVSNTIDNNERRIEESDQPWV